MQLPGLATVGGGGPGGGSFVTFAFAVLLCRVTGFEMFKSALTRWWDMQKIYHTQVHQELWVGALLTSLIFYKISYGGKKKSLENKSSSGHH
ncbi:ATP synthase subunit ATP5MPL, mitochondrial [Podarcis lilfordi]|uniref:ATP synthase subunit ATP5MPL, mitochondrial n=1 Tax=Podarcis lilfordi TaxID=74358 RepID=A0AA35NUI4_9SAUR|nr:ATP synthase subunit ATP5MPL, mitochondrial [Podarcis lilfordi]